MYKGLERKDSPTILKQDEEYVLTAGLGIMGSKVRPGDWIAVLLMHSFIHSFKKAVLSPGKPQLNLSPALQVSPSLEGESQTGPETPG